jgi:hypothetical protein
MIHKDEDDNDEAPADTAVPHRCRIMNMHTGATLWIQLPSFEEYSDFLTDAKGFLLFYCVRTETVLLFIPPDHHNGCPPSFLCGARPGGSQSSLLQGASSTGGMHQREIQLLFPTWCSSWSRNSRSACIAP